MKIKQNEEYICKQEREEGGINVMFNVLNCWGVLGYNFQINNTVMILYFFL